MINSTKDAEALTLTLVAEFDADVERSWQVWEDPRLLERWWGPPTWPATFDQHGPVAGGTSQYHMTGPDGVVTLESLSNGATRMTLLSSFPSLDVLDRMVEMGMQEGLRLAVGQIDEILAEPTDPR